MHPTARLVLVLPLALGLAACTDFLESKPKGELSSGNFFTQPDHAIQATNATYNILRQWEVHVFSWIGETDIASDDATKGSVPGDAGSGYLGDLDDLTFDAANLAFTQTWTGYYQGIYRANLAIQGIPRVPMDSALKARLIGENKFLRAYYYFFLVRAHGGVPLFTHPPAPSEYTRPRATETEVYDQIEQDLLDAIAVLPQTYPTADLGRATRGAARGLLAEAYLYQQKYANALEQADSVINSGYALYPDYTTLFTQAGENSSESVFEVQTATTPGAGCQPDQGCSNIQYSEVQGVRGTPNLGWGFNTPSPSLEADYEPGDPRLEATILYPWEQIPDGTGRVVYLNPGMPNNRYSEKAFISPETPGGTFNSGKNLRRLRYADVLLIGAEAAYQTGAIGKAQTYLNQVRARARGTHTKTLAFTPEPLAESIAQTVLGLAAGTSRVAVRYVNPTSAAFTAGLKGFKAHCANGTCASAAVPPVRVDTLDVVQTVDGSPVTTVQQFQDSVDTKTAGTPVALGVLRITQDSATGTVTTTPALITIDAQTLLPDVTLTGQALRDAIWHERRVELAMEEQRFFDMRRQDFVSPGRMAALMTAHGHTWQPKFALYPIPASEVQISGLTQNPGY
jgi:hypothetical protein